MENKFHSATFSRHFCPKQLTVIQTLIVVAAIQGANEHIRRNLGFAILSKDISTRRPGESTQRPSTNKMLALPLSQQPIFDILLVMAKKKKKKKRRSTLMVCCGTTSGSCEIESRMCSVKHKSLLIEEGNCIFLFSLFSQVMATNREVD